jgi:2-keto-4-pentenoate hydratase/2-oxohepta-3-ene-1,7-dioic acid hydratase in catechol pathway
MKIICIGRNYVNHIAELNNERPDEPVIFLKPDTAILPKLENILMPNLRTSIMTK